MAEIMRFYDSATMQILGIRYLNGGISLVKSLIFTSSSTPVSCWRFPVWIHLQPIREFSGQADMDIETWASCSQICTNHCSLQ